MRATRVLAALIATTVLGAFGVNAAQADTLTVAGPSVVVIGSTSLIHYTVHGQADPNTDVHWDLTGKSYCYFDFGSTTSDSSGNYASVGSVQPTVDVNDDSCAGAAVLSVDAFDNQELTVTKTVLLKHAAKWVGVNATPEPITSGQLVTITGQLQHASWEDGRYHGFGTTAAYLQFRSLTGPYKNYGKGTTSTGLMVRHVHQRISGCWRYTFIGTSTNNTATSGGDCVYLR